MKRKVYYCSLLLLLLVFLLFQNFKESPEIISPNGEGSPRQIESPKNTVPANLKNGTTALAKNGGKLDSLRSLAKLSNKSIDFYGLVLDQDNNPVPNVKVTLGIRVTKEPVIGMIGDVFDSPVVKTDSEGRFSIVDAKGALLSVKSLEKVGYEASQQSLNRAHYWYWRDPSQVHHPDINKPEVFRMWKKRGAEDLVVGEGFFWLIPDGRVYTIDILNKNKTEGKSSGDIMVSINRPLQITTKSKYDWGCEIECIDGGIVETTEEQAYLAPEGGYNEIYKVSFGIGDANWSDSAKRQLYLKSRGGKLFARLEVEIIADYRDKAVFSVKYYANPTGSRNLEYDPLQGLIPSERARARAERAALEKAQAEAEK
jgi:hypothetical protein